MKTQSSLWLNRAAVIPWWHNSSTYTGFVTPKPILEVLYVPQKTTQIYEFVNTAKYWRWISS